jgi:CTP:molybdopterin cytidylyltransferase MocA
LRPITERWAKPVLPIDGRAVLASLLHELASAGVPKVWLVTGHLASQVEAVAGDGSAFGLEVRLVSQPRPDGSADAVTRAVEAGVAPPFLVSAADTLYARGTVAQVLGAWDGADAGSITVRSQAGRPAATRIRVENGLVSKVPDPGAPGGVTAAPLLVVGPAVAAEIPAVCSEPYVPPYELTAAFQRAIEAGERVRAIEIRPTRDLTDPLDLVRENFPYVQGLR